MVLLLEVELMEDLAVSFVIADGGLALRQTYFLDAPVLHDVFLHLLAHGESVVSCFFRKVLFEPFAKL